MWSAISVLVWAAAEDPVDAFYDRAPSWDELSGFAEVAVTAVVAIVGGAWVVTKYFDERRRQMDATVELERQRLDQQRREEVNRRAERASALVLELGKSENVAGRWMTASAMTMYAQELTPVLISALGHAAPQTASAISTALVSIGEPVLGPLTRATMVASTMQRISGADSTNLIDPTGQLLANARAVVSHILVLHTTEESRAELDLAGVDLSTCSFAEADLRGIRFRKTVLDDCSFRRAKLHDANLRGASVTGANFAHAVLTRADLTGLIASDGRGVRKRSANMVRLQARKAVFDNADLDGVRLEGADLTEVSMDGTRLTGAALGGATLDGAHMTRAQFGTARARKLKMSNATATECSFSGVHFEEVVLSGTRFDRCRLEGAFLSAAVATGAVFEECHMGGANLLEADLCKSMFKGCVLGGTELAGADLDGVVFDGCDLTGFPFASVNLRGVTMKGDTVFRIDDLVDADDSCLEATFEGGALALKDALLEARRGRTP